MSFTFVLTLVPGYHRRSYCFTVSDLWDNEFCERCCNAVPAKGNVAVGLPTSPNAT
ncbi:hypothetical protein PGT21_001439 [Puccinia graminis f. sp. tritici]|uniref:Uncharacterized protein n=1 Tax=Puccinia graminis f. sp. tritici TaxID=56615 RepID=A0A5B0RRK5_PUCGR|nr:hypothetical protein PGT21_001439 [Puccinia graminis f. sp. tritici]KAA1127918.1 hypothetical protein PGTUg99_011016 [Puccinia graminis f. sp. tritici]